MQEDRQFDFDTIVERRGTDSGKWQRYGDDVLPMWVADMDFLSPEPIRLALQERVDHGVFGYARDPADLREIICERILVQHDWRVNPDELVFLPGLVCGLNVVARAVGEPGDGVVINTPVYPPFHSAATNQDRKLQTADLAQRLRRTEQGQPYLHYEIDFGALEATTDTDSALFILCNPHNPVGRVFTRAELEQLADFCLTNQLVICADEIHCDLLLDGSEHISIASLDPAVADRTITLIAPSKTFNIPGLGCSVAIVQNPALRADVQRAMRGIVPHVNIMGYVATKAAYGECTEWMLDLRSYLTENRDFVFEFVSRHMPEVQVTRAEATYLAWLDCRNSVAGDHPYRFFLENAKVALNDGAAFGSAGKGHVRLNFGCPRSVLQEGLERLCTSLRAESKP